MEQPVKERLVGAVIIVALAVIFVPMLFDGDGHREFSRLQVEMPAPPALVFGQHFSALGDQASPSAPSVPDTPSAMLDAAPDAAPAAASSADAPLSSTTARAVTPRRPPVVAAPPAPAAKAPAPRAARAVSQLDIWVVQVGVYALRKNADEQRAKLSKAGFSPVFYKQHKNQRGETVYYVRIGPYEGRSAAARVAERLRREHEIKAIVRTYGDND